MQHDVAVNTLAAERYFLGEMERDERDSFEEHFFECSVCAQDVRAGAAMIANINMLGTPGEAPPAVSRKPSTGKSGWFHWLRPSFASPAFAALMVAAFGVESVYLVQVQRQANKIAEPRALAAVTLKAESRSAPVTLAVEPGRPLLLRFDVNTTQAAVVYHYAVKTAAGDTVLESTQPAPSGSEVQFYIPKPNLTPGRYLLVVSGSSTPGGPLAELGRYYFEVRLNQEPPR